MPSTNEPRGLNNEDDETRYANRHEIVQPSFFGPCGGKSDAANPLLVVPLSRNTVQLDGLRGRTGREWPWCRSAACIAAAPPLAATMLVIEGPLGRATPPPFNFCFGTQLQIGERKHAMQNRRLQDSCGVTGDATFKMMRPTVFQKGSKFSKKSVCRALEIHRK